MRVSKEVDALVAGIGARLVRDENYLSRPWDAIALVVEIDGAAVRMHGYCYLDTGETVAENPDGRAAAWFLDLHERLREAEARPWKACLVQILREGAKVSFRFEYEDPKRWAVTPFNWRERREELRPQ